MCSTIIRICRVYNTHSLDRAYDLETVFTKSDVKPVFPPLVKTAKNYP